MDTEKQLPPGEDMMLATGEAAPKPEISERDKVLQALDFARSVAKENMATDEDRWIVKSVEDAYSNSISKGKDTYTNTFTNDEVGKEYHQEEGIPTEYLLQNLSRKASQLPQDSPEFVEIKEAFDILQGHSETYEKIHEEALKNNPEESDLLRGRKKQEAYYISHSDDPREKGNLTENWHSGEDYLSQRRELVLPKEEEKKNDVEEPKDKGQDKPEEDKKQEEKPTPPVPTKPTLPTEVAFGIAAGKTRIEHLAEGNKKVESVERLEEMAREQARAKMTEERHQWEKRLNLKTSLTRFWKTTIGEAATYGKEKNQAVKLLAEGGLQMNTLPYEFQNQLTEAARKNIDQQRGKGIKRFMGGVRDIFNEAAFKEKDLHREQVVLMGSLRKAVENPDDPDSKKFIQANPDLVRSFSDVLTGDFAASEALAAKISAREGPEIVQEVINSRAGEKVSKEPIVLDGEIRTYLVDNVVKKILTDGLTNNGLVKPETLVGVRRSVQELFFRPEFVKWYDSQSDEVKSSLQLSLSYGSDIAKYVQEEILPQAINAKEHLSSTANLDEYINSLVLKVNVGTLEAVTKGVVDEGKIDRAASRSITNKETLALYQKLRTQNQAPTLIPDTYLNNAVSRASLLDQVTRISTNQVLWGVGTAVGLYAARRAGGALAPIIGGSLVAGILGYAQEGRLFSRESEQHGVESELGYQFADDAKRREQMQKIEMHKRPMTELTSQMQQRLDEIKNGNDTNSENTAKLMGLIADTQARIYLGDQIGQGLLAASGENMSDFQHQKTDLEKKRAEAQVELRKTLVDNPAKLTELQNSLGITTIPQGANPADYIINQLTENQMQHLRNGTGIEARFQIAMTNMGIEKGDTIAARQKAWDSVRTKRQLMAFAKTGIFGAATATGMYYGSHFAFSALGELVAGKLPTITMPENIKNTVTAVPSFIDKIKEAASGGHHEIITNNNFSIDLNPDGTPTGTVSFVDHVHGTNIFGHSEMGADGRPHILIDDQNLSPENLHQMQAELKAQGWEIGEKTVERPTLGATGEWTKHATEVDHRLRYTNDTSGRSDFNELREYTEKSGKTITIDMHAMQQGWQHGINPDKVDVQQVIQQGKAGFYITTDADPQHGIWITEGTDGVVDGKLVLNPDDYTHVIQTPNGAIPIGDVSKMVINQDVLQTLNDGNIATEAQNHQNVFNLSIGGKPGYIEAGSMTQEGDKNVLQVFATISGTGHLPENVEIKIPELIPPLPEVPTPGLPGLPEIPNPRDIVVEPGLPGKFNWDLTVPFFIPRTPLEQPERGKNKPKVKTTSPEPTTPSPNYSIMEKQIKELEKSRSQIEKMPGTTPTERQQRAERLNEVDNQIAGLHSQLPATTTQSPTPTPQTAMPQATTTPGAPEKRETPPNTTTPPSPEVAQAMQQLPQLRKELNDLYNTPNPTPEQLQELQDLQKRVKELNSTMEFKPGTKQLESYFKEIPGKVDQNNQYLIRNPIEILNTLTNLPENQQSEFLNSIPTITEPFFISRGGTVYSPNQKVIPIDYFENDQRFQNAEAATKGDSGLFALAAASAETPTQQTVLYALMAGIIQDIHMNNPNLLPTWIQGQQQPMAPELLSPLEIILRNDHVGDRATNALKPENERLLTYKQDGAPDLTQFNELWGQRIDELSRLNGKFEPHHLRWLEFLSHSVELPALMKKLKELEPATQTRSTSPQPVQPTPSAATQTPTEVENLRNTLETTIAPEINITRQVGFTEAQGRRSSMEDAHAIVENFGGKSDQAFYAIYDGHGGREVADFAAKRLHNNLLQSLYKGEDPILALKNAYRTTDDQIKSNNISPDTGSTAVTALIQGDKLYVANAGDARAVLSRNGQALRLSYDHKPEASIRRIEDAGGFVSQDPGGPSRVQNELAVSRSLGDWGLKRFVISEPHIAQETLGSGDQYLVLNCDGMNETMTDQEIIDFIKNEPDPQKASQMLKDEALKRGSGDNISVMVINLNQQNIPQPVATDQKSSTPENSPVKPPINSFKTPKEMNNAGYSNDDIGLYFISRNFGVTSIPKEEEGPRIRELFISRGMNVPNHLLDPILIKSKELQQLVIQALSQPVQKSMPTTSVPETQPDVAETPEQKAKREMALQLEQAIQSLMSTGLTRDQALQRLRELHALKQG